MGCRGGGGLLESVGCSDSSEQRQTESKEGTGGTCVCSARGLAAGQGNGIGELRILVVVVFSCVLVSGQHKPLISLPLSALPHVL